MHLDPVIPLVVMVALIILAVGIVLKRLKQPYVVAYLLVGMLIGPQGLGLITDQAVVSRLGSMGVVMLLFFIGMEVSPRRLAANWKVAVLGTLIQITISVTCLWLIGTWLDWPVTRSVLLGFVISLSSTAVVLKLLQDWQELETRVGQDTLGILLVQDLALVPMVIVIGVMGGESVDAHVLLVQILGGIAVIGLAIWVGFRERIHLPFLRLLGNDREMQVFAALTICFGLALITGLAELSTALGAFVGGMIVAAARETHWVHHSLESLRILFVALFFLSVGMLVDLQFLWTHLIQITTLVSVAMLVNTLINASTLRFLGDRWRRSLYAGAILAQVGEFSFILAALGLRSEIIDAYSYQLAVAVISLSLLLSPIWIVTVKRLLKVDALPIKSRHGYLNKHKL